MAIYAGFIGGSYQSQSPLADQERTINWYPENMESKGATVPTVLYPTPGVVTLGSGAVNFPGLAHFWDPVTSREFAVIGNSFVEIDRFGVITSRGSVAVGSTPATISGNGKAGAQLMITAGTNLYIFAPSTNTLTQVVAMNGKATMGDQMDGFFIALDSATSTFYFSSLNDGLTWDPTTDFSQRNLASDPWVSMKVANKFIYLFGSETSEVWYDAGTFPIPFAPYPSGIMPYGCDAPFSPVVANGVLVWLGSTNDGKNTVLRASGFTPEVISTYAMSTVLTDFATTSDAVGDTYTDLGHTFFLLSFPAANRTFCFDVNTSLWHERGTWIPNLSQFNAWRPRFHVFAFGEHRMLDGETGAVYHMSSDFTSDVDDRQIRRLRSAPCLYNENERVFISSFELDLEIANGNVVDPGANPQVMIRMSPDGGKTWGTEHMRSSGKIGKYGTRVRLLRCGQARRRIFEVSVTDNNPWNILGAYIKTVGEQAQSA